VRGVLQSWCDGCWEGLTKLVVLVHSSHSPAPNTRCCRSIIAAVDRDVDSYKLPSLAVACQALAAIGAVPSQRLLLRVVRAARTQLQQFNHSASSIAKVRGTPKLQWDWYLPFGCRCTEALVQKRAALGLQFWLGHVSRLCPNTGPPTNSPLPLHLPSLWRT
jgi:hypothetical protein